MRYETTSTIEFAKLLYKILSFKCELETREVEILIWKFYNKLNSKEIGLLLGISRQKVISVYSNLVCRIKEGNICVQILFLLFINLRYQ